MVSSSRPGCRVGKLKAPLVRGLIYKEVIADHNKVKNIILFISLTVMYPNPQENTLKHSKTCTKTPGSLD